MTQLLLSKVLAPATVGSAKLPGLRAYAVQVVHKTPKMFWVTKPYIIRNIPVTAVNPTARQAEWRLTFTRESSKWKGARGYDTFKQDSRSGKHRKGDLGLKVQVVAQEVLKAAPRPRNARSATWDEGAKRYRSYLRYERNTPERLAEIAGVATV